MITEEENELLKKLEYKRDNLRHIIRGFDSKYVTKNFGFNKITAGIVDTFLDNGRLRSVRFAEEETEFLHRNCPEVIKEMRKYTLKLLKGQLKAVEDELSKIIK